MIFDKIGFFLEELWEKSPESVLNGDSQREIDVILSEIRKYYPIKLRGGPKKNPLLETNVTGSGGEKENKKTMSSGIHLESTRKMSQIPYLEQRFSNTDLPFVAEEEKTP